MPGGGGTMSNVKTYFCLINNKDPFYSFSGSHSLKTVTSGKHKGRMNFGSHTVQNFQLGFVALKTTVKVIS